MVKGRSPALVYCVFLALLLLAMVVGAASVGAARLSLEVVWRVLFDFLTGAPDQVFEGSAAARMIVIDVRLPRILTALLVGAALGVAGVACATDRDQQVTAWTEPASHALQ